MSEAVPVHGPLPLTDADRLSEEDLLRAYPWPAAGPWVRAMMVTTLDGAAAGPDRLSGSVSSPADQLIFNAVRRDADAVLIGAGTLRAEQYTPMRAKPADASRREAAGQAPAPVVAVVSGSLQLPWELPFWRESTCKPVVLTAVDAAPGPLATAREHADVIVLERTSPQAIIDALVARNLTRIVCEGGPHLLRDLVAADLVDEADITVSPVFAGTEKSPTTAALPQVTEFRLAHALHGDNTMMMRYLAPGR
ncbi:MAG TPA: dihydrofolate reductase family protein [Flexivirga sp.]|uniref:dihydrofolate reductase family protein n=1 Tax=Flexivirga sp. TaxID=1962927 RepID=UPI002C626069|nr:dihydrofolate reductase family protein [Flexivirga sp.]HWC22974.1 dihydrofolate reductase family protein [Flexivirga sp.]